MAMDQFVRRPLGCVAGGSPAVLRRCFNLSKSRFRVCTPLSVVSTRDSTVLTESCTFVVFLYFPNVVLFRDVAHHSRHEQLHLRHRDVGVGHCTWTSM